MKLILVIILILVALLLSACSTQQVQQIDSVERDDIIISSSSAESCYSNTYLFYDGTFLNSRNCIRGSKACSAGEIPKDKYDSFIAFVKNSGLLDAKITQDGESSLMCERGSWIKVVIGNRANSLHLTCTSSYTKSSNDAKIIMSEVSTRLDELVTASFKQECVQGGYIKTTQNWVDCTKYNCTGVEEFSVLDSNLQKSLKNEDAFIYVGPVNETTIKYHRKQYALGQYALSGFSYYVLLYVFDGDRFMHYDDLKRFRDYDNFNKQKNISSSSTSFNQNENVTFTLNFFAGGSITGSSFEVKISGTYITYRETRGEEVEKIERSLLPTELDAIRKTVTDAGLISLQSQNFTQDDLPIPDQASYRISLSLDDKENTIYCVISPEPTTECQSQINKLRMKLNNILGVNIY